jgi:hypothetical protein
VWASETGEEFEVKWNGIITDFGLGENEWMTNRFEIRKSWIPAYFMDVPLTEDHEFSED